MAKIHFKKRILIQLLIFFFTYALVYWIIKSILWTIWKETLPFQSNKIAKKWIIVSNSKSTVCSEFCRNYPFWHVLCFITDKYDDTNGTLFERFPNCYPVNSAEFDSESVFTGRMDYYIKIIELGASHVRFFQRNQRRFSDLKLEENLFQYQDPTLYILTQPHHTSACTNDSSTTFHHLNLCRDAKPPIMMAPVADILCSTDLTVSLQPELHYTQVDPYTAVLGRKSLWILFFLDHYGKLSASMQTLFMCLVQWLGWMEGRQVQLYYNPGIQRLSQSTPIEHGCLDFEKLMYLNMKRKQSDEFKEQILQVIGTLFPKLTQRSIAKWFSELKKVNYQWLDEGKSSTPQLKCFNVNYQPISRVVNNVVVSRNLMENSDIVQSTHKRMCDDLIPLRAPQETRMSINEIALLIVFNNPHYEVIPLLEIMYRSIFPLIIYCGPIEIDYTRYKELQQFKLSFVVYSSQHAGRMTGELNYQCLMNVIGLNLNTKGFLVVSDDLIPLLHNTQFLPLSNIWYLPDHEISICDLGSMKECIRGECELPCTWRWWVEYRKESLEALHDIKNLSRSSSLFHHCLNVITNSTGDSNRIFGGYSDIYYLPKSRSTDFYALAQVFLQRGVFLEIAIPTIFKCLSGSDYNVVPLRGAVQWSASDRDLPWKHFKMSKLIDKHYFHPIKLSNISPLTSKLPVAREYLELTNNNVSHPERTFRLMDLFCTVIVPYLRHEDFEVPV